MQYGRDQFYYFGKQKTENEVLKEMFLKNKKKNKIVIRKP